MVKAISMMKRKPGLTREEFSSYWYQKHAPLVTRVVPGLRKYVQNHPLAAKVPGVESALDGIAEIWFDDLDSYRNYVAWRGAEPAKVLLADEDKFVDGKQTVRFLAEERFIMG